MDINETKECIRVMQEFVDGKVIQSRILGTKIWGCMDQYPVQHWNWMIFEYRIKPEPKIIYGNEYKDGSMCMYSDVDKAANCAGISALAVAVPYIRLSDVGLLK